jgi:hypothetical protein
MRRRIIVSILIGLTFILSTFISTVSIVQKLAYAQVRTEPTSNLPVPNSMTQRSTVVGSNAEPGRNSAVQGVTGALSSLHGTSGIGTSQDIHSIASNVAASINNIKKIISAATTVTGIALLAAGIHSLIKHAKERAQGGHLLPDIGRIPNH